MAGSNGNDGNSGTQSAPFKTLERGFGVLLPGDTLYVRGGTYQGFYSTLKIPSGNSWAQPVTIKAYQQEKVVLTAAPGRSPIRFAVGSHHIIVDGFILDGRGGNAGIITGENSHHIRILNSEVMNAPHSGILTNTGSSFFEFVNLRIHDNGSSHFDHGLYIATSNHLVKDCLIYRNTGWGVHIYSGAGLQPGNNLIMNNKVYQNATSGNGIEIGIYSGAGNSVINNLVWSTKTGINVNSGASQTSVYNNTIYKGAYGIVMGDSSSGTKVFNNIISSSATFGLHVNKNSQNSQIKNNLIYNSGQKDILNQSPTTTLNNNFEGNNFNPHLQNPESFDFHLQSGSPAIDAGLGISEVGHDFDYISRPQGSSHDIGAHER
ncbi:MAG: right-handed parallel beta-helix repeat-containing protein [Nitrospirales bacterium]|nr:right-handed parallel beta-helix repeat-containing protein [Nitrospirales bacterium]